MIFFPLLIAFRTFFVGNYYNCRDSSVTIDSGYGLDGQGSIPGRRRNFSLLPRVQNVSGAHPASNSMGTGDSSYGDNAVRE
jgi:hypothetical protein